ncbi:uncharacterized protein BCR38DRAFT_490047 [Pseudomassariella vexata]|uniref:Fucose-specific lectin n=1 Tax=Pseudomassariella vexata TaxID=1141098 RepID=A0A1Y2DEM3_9PEZI|nr:uncharacterized protein BCR38DRAFT_490047 [Pseudomassariella vexata]ORY57544.1 hypothetical protein BCR38DRAFT_490047 [Pseudomassariella vexata]
MSLRRASSKTVVTPSNLEVCDPDAISPFDDQKEPAITFWDDEKQPVCLPPSPKPWTSRQLQVKPSSNPTSDNAAREKRETSNDQRRLKILGLGRWKFAIVVVLVLFIIGGIAGGVVAATRNSRSPPRKSMILGVSNLAAVNWTTGPDAEVHAVFFQDPDDSLMAYIDNNDGTTAMVNITGIFEKSDPLAMLSGTPIAAAANSDPHDFGNITSNRLNVFFLTPENIVTEITTHDPILQDWSRGSLGPHRDVTITTANGSQLAAVWQRCDNPSICGKGRFYLAFEDKDQNFVIANSTYDWDASTASTRLALNSSATLISMNYGNDSDYVWGFYETNNILGSAWQDYTTNWWWIDTGRNVMYEITTSLTNHFAATSINHRRDAFMSALYPNGTIIGKHWNFELDNWRPQSALNLFGGPAAPNFTSIAMTANARLYGISGGQVLCYLMGNISDPFTFDFLGSIP